MRNIHNNLLYVGNAFDGRDLNGIFDAGIRAVVDLAINEAPAQLAREIVYCRFPLNDGGGNQDELITLAIRTIAGLVERKLPTLVVCSAGMSRAPTIAAAALALATQQEPDACLLKIIANAPNDVSPILWDHIKRIYRQAT